MKYKWTRDAHVLAMDIINFVVIIDLVIQQVNQPCMALLALSDEVLTFYKCLISVCSIYVVSLDFIWKIQRFPLMKVWGGRQYQ